MRHPYASPDAPESATFDCQTHTVTDTPGPSPLGDHRYAAGAHDIVRFAPDPADEAICEFVDRTRTMSRQQIQATRDRLDGDDDLYTLLTFARRQTVRALRDGDLDAASCGIDALTLITRDRIDYRDLSVDFPLFAIRELGGDLAGTIDRAIARCEPGTARYFEARREGAPSLTLADCALIRVTTAHGVGFMDDWTGTGTPPTGLVVALVRLADLIDGEGSYVVRDMKVTDLPEVWFTGGRSVGNVATSGCVSLNADHVSSTHPYSHALMVFVAELASAPPATALVRAASTASTTDRPRSAIQAGQFIAVFIGGSATMGEVSMETDNSLERFHPLALAALAEISG